MKLRILRRNRLYFAASSLLVFFFLALSARAAEEGGTAGAETADHIFKWINFAIVIGIMVWLFGKKLPGWFHANADNISAAITKATAAREEAERQVREAETKLAHLQQEIASLHATAVRESAAEGERIQALTQSDAKKVGVAAQAEIEAAERAARFELKALAASLAVDGAESLLAKQLTPAGQETLVDSFVKSLEGRPN
jgi:F-type H+-transporting ATPase subunit b